MLHHVESPVVTESTLRLSPLATSAPGEVLEETALQQDVLALFDRFRDPLLRYVCANGIAVGEGEDVVQEVFLLLFRHLQRGGSRSNLQGWLFRVAHNLTLKRRARLWRDAARGPRDVQAAVLLIDPEPSPDLRLVERERRHRLWSVFCALSLRERQCLHLRHDGLRYREIATLLGISLGAVAKTVARAIGRLERADER